MSATVDVVAPGSRPEPLVDLSGLVAGLRWRRRTWVGLALLGLLLGVASTVVFPTGSTAVARVYVAHEEESFTNATTIGETDVALFETTQVAEGALTALGVTDLRPQDLLRTYQVKAIAANILEVSVAGRDGPDALAKAQALADAYIAAHVGRIQVAADAVAAALNDRRAAAQSQLDALADDIADVAGRPATPATAAQLEALYAGRAGLNGQIQDLGQRAQEASIGAPRVAAGTIIVDAPRIAARSSLVAAGIAGAVGLVLGLGVGLGLALIGTVVSDRPVLRRDIAAHLGASVIAQLPAPRRGPSRLWRRSGPVAERRRVAAVLARVVGTVPGGVSLLEVGCPRPAAALAVEIATEMAADRVVVLIDDLPRRHVQAIGSGAPVEVLDGASFPVSAAEEATQYLGVGSTGPGTAWTDLARLGAETLLIVRAGTTPAARLHEVARQLVDVGVHVIGIVLVHPDPRDGTDGTLWDGLHHALRGRAAAIAARYPDELVLVPAPDGHRNVAGAGHNSTNGSGSTGSGSDGNANNGSTNGTNPAVDVTAGEGAEVT